MVMPRLEYSMDTLDNFQDVALLLAAMSTDRAILTSHVILKGHDSIKLVIKAVNPCVIVCGR
jgi:hypothetical protein